MNKFPHTVISIRQSGQQIAQNHVIKAKSCTIGRAWDNDIVISDAKCPDYIGEIKNDMGHLSFHCSQSGELYGLLQSGEQLAKEYTNGVNIHIYLSNHPIAVASPPNLIQMISQYATLLSVAIIALILSIGLDLWLVVQRQVEVFEWYDVFDNQLTKIVSVLLIAFILAVITKFVKQEKHFSTYLTLISVYVIITATIEYLSRIAYFNYPSPAWPLITELLSSLVMLVLLMRIIIDLISFWDAKKSWALAVAIGVMFFYNQNGKYWLEEEGFSDVPLVNTEIFPNYLRFNSGMAVEAIISQSDELFDKVDEQRDKD